MLVMSGLSGADRDFASRVADVILIVEESAEAANAAAADLRCRAFAVGRKPEAVKVLLTVAVGSELNVDKLRALLVSSGCDGLHLALPADVQELQNFTDRVLPEIRLGLADQGQPGTTLRARLRLGGAK